ncbi:VOC family protein [Thalassobacillus pellis]|uniref:VOC family protein n=1 Tax=Thalassobacillus pellis TaxID=748008 RepID=UPI001EF7A6B5|nr:VOC family protein [Thalassobacillus pellis]
MERGFEPKVHAVFVHTKNLKKSAGWYSRLLGLPFDEKEVRSPVYNVPVTGEVYMTIDDHAFDDEYQFKPAKTPVFNFCSDNLEQSHRWIKENNIPVTRPIEKHGNFGWFHIEDPDGNAVMICGNCTE